MKTNFVTLLFCLSFSAVCLAEHEQDSIIVKAIENPEISEPETTNTSSVTYNGSPYNFIFSWKKKHQYEPHWTGFGMAFIGFSELEDVYLKSSKSYSFMLNLTSTYLPLYHNWLMVSGIGLDFSRYHFKGDVGLGYDGLNTAFIPSADPDIHYRSSRLLTYYVTIPLLIEYQKSVAKNKGFYLSGGIVGYVKYYSQSRVEHSITRQRVKLGTDLNILPVNVRFMLQAGIQDVSIFAYYSPISLIENGKGPELKPMGIGLRLDF